MKNNRSIIECCNITNQEMPRTSKQTSACTSDLSDASHVTCMLAINIWCHCVWKVFFVVFGGL